MVEADGLGRHLRAQVVREGLEAAVEAVLNQADRELRVKAPTVELVDPPISLSGRMVEAVVVAALGHPGHLRPTSLVLPVEVAPHGRTVSLMQAAVVEPPEHRHRCQVVQVVQVAAALVGV